MSKAPEQNPDDWEQQLKAAGLSARRDEDWLSWDTINYYNNIYWDQNKKMRVAFLSNRDRFCSAPPTGPEYMRFGTKEWNGICLRGWSCGPNYGTGMHLRLYINPH